MASKVEDTTYDVMVLDAFGRGQWLAGELASRGFKVGVADFSKALSSLSGSAWDGPMVFFEQVNVMQTQKNFFGLESSAELQNAGFAIFSDQGILEMQEPMAQFLFEKAGLAPACLSYLKDPTARLRGELNRTPFMQTWPAALAHSVFSHGDSLPTDALGAGSARSLTAPMWIRHWTAKEWDHLLNRLRAQNVEVWPAAELNDFRLFGKNVDSIELKTSSGKGGAKSEAVTSRTWVNMLAGAELKSLKENFAHDLEMSVVCPKLSWVMAELRLEGELAIASLPRFFLWLNRVAEPWSNGNFAILKRVANSHIYQAWVRVPFEKQNDRKHNTSIFEELSRRLCELTTLTSAKIESLPVDIDKPQDQGSCPFPVYSARDVGKAKKSKFRNWFNYGPDAEEHFDWAYRFAFQNDIILLLEKWREQARKAHPPEIST